MQVFSLPFAAYARAINAVGYFGFKCWHLIFSWTGSFKPCVEPFRRFPLEMLCVEVGMIPPQYGCVAQGRLCTYVACAGFPWQVFFLSTFNDF